MNEIALLCQQLQERALPLAPLPVELNRIRQAAVTILLREHQQTAELLIIKRAEHPNDPWSGHLALPGGRADAVDEHLIATAARETREEVGISLNWEDHFIGRLATLLPGNPRLPQIEITPLIAVAPTEPVLLLSEEVADAFWMPVRALQETGLSDVYRFHHQDAILKYPAYPSPGGPIWGITQRILTEFLGLLE
ncbi:MAG TPA: CoA pyrophosphatase [Blastocatellia bacterium]|nr:CoA pyrophosphatase [Blastocatellia bacterium]